jgi:hypothetical protein
LIISQFSDDLLGFSLRSALSVKAGAKRRDNGDKILKQVFLAISRRVDHLNGAALLFEQSLNVIESEARQSVLMFNHNSTRRRIIQQFNQSRSLIVNARAKFLDYSANLIASGDTILARAFSLRIEIRLVFGSRYSGLNYCAFLNARGGIISNDDCASRHLLSIENPGFKPSPGRSVGNALTLRVVR